MALPKDAPVKDILLATIKDLEENGRQKGRNQTIEHTSRSLPGAIVNSVGHLVTMHNMSHEARATLKRVAEFLGIYDLEKYNEETSDGAVLDMLRRAVNEATNA